MASTPETTPETTLEASSTKTAKNQPDFDHTKVEQVKLKRSANGKDIVIDLPVEEINRENFPAVTIVTVTRNRKHFFPLAIDNWKRVYYPEEKLTWLVVDDSDSLEQSPIKLLKDLKDPKRVLFYYLPPKTEDGKLVGHSIGYKRNLAMTLIKTDFVAMVDDDDFLYPESIMSRMCSLLFYGKQCVYSDELGVYSVHHENSYILEGFQDVPEGTLMFTKKFWEKNKFGEGTYGEGGQLVAGRELDMIRVPYFFNVIVLNHHTNITGKGRNIRFANTGALKNRASVSAPLNFYKLEFPKSFKDALKILAENNQAANPWRLDHTEKSS
jgi:hypothetical protein